MDGYSEEVYVLLHIFHFVSMFSLTHLKPIFRFDTSWKRQKTRGSMTFSKSIEMEHGLKMG